MLSPFYPSPTFWPVYTGEAMTQPMRKQLRAIGEFLKLDCGDNSCLSTPTHGGMRTNGGCRCDFVAAVTEQVAFVKALLESQEKLTAENQELDRKNRRIVDEWNVMNEAHHKLLVLVRELQDQLGVRQ